MPKDNAPKTEKKARPFVNPFRPATASHSLFELGKAGFVKWDDLKDAIESGKSQVEFMRDYARLMFTVVTKDGKHYIVPTIPDPEYLKEKGLENSKAVYQIG